MTRSRPLWVCSCYGPGRDAPTQLIAGSDLEISPEELRVDHYLKMANGQSADETVRARAPPLILKTNIGRQISSAC